MQGIGDVNQSPGGVHLPVLDEQGAYIEIIWSRIPVGNRKEGRGGGRFFTNGNDPDAWGSVS
ncbi:MAG: hypothetical protein Kow009_01900 [Spirochaetales bacterium]